MHLGQDNLVVVDVETTGLSPEKHRIIEIAALRVTEGFVVDTFHSLINPECELPREIIKLTGIRQADVDPAPLAAEVIPDFLNFLDNSIFVAHNCSFDWGMVHGELRRLGLPKLKNQQLCTVRLARRLLPHLKSKGLASLMQHYGLNPNGHHRALNDVRVTSDILSRLLFQLESDHNISDTNQVLRFQYRRQRK